MKSPFRYISDGLAWFKNPYNFLDKKILEGRFTFIENLPVLGRVLFTGESEIIKSIVTSGKFQKGRGVGALKSILGDDSLIMKDGSEHLERRSLVSPSFKGKVLENYDLFTMDYTQKVFEKLQIQKPFSIYEITRKISLRVIIFSIFGKKNEDEYEHIELLINEFLNSFKSPLVLFLKPLQIDLGFHSPWGRAVYNKKKLCEYISTQIKSSKSLEKYCILNNLLSKKDMTQALTEQEIISEVLALLLFGHDTGAATFSWIMLHLHQEKKVLQRLQKEVYNKSFGELINQNTYLEACLKESMRLSPVVVHLTRKALEDVRLGEYTLKKGDTVLPCMYLAQHNPNIFPEPNTFLPERFLKKQKYEYSYFPFGLGVRTCIGKPFVMRQMKIMLSVIIKNFHLEFARNYTPSPKRHFVLILPKDGTMMVKVK